MAEKKSFLLYTGYFEQIEMLNIEQRGILLTAIMAFQTDTEMPEMDAITKMAFSFISADMRRDNEKYEEIVERRKESGRKGGLATQAKRANQANATFATFASNSEFKQNQANQANQAVNVDVDVDVNDNDNVNDDVDVNVDEPAPDGRQSQTTQHTYSTSETEPTGRPSNLDVLGEMVSKGYQLTPASITAFMEYNDERGWKMDWRLALKRWADKEKPPDQPKKNLAGKFANFQQRDDAKHKAMVSQLIAMQSGGD